MRCQADREIEREAGAASHWGWARAGPRATGPPGPLADGRQDDVTTDCSRRRIKKP